jgi:hypothetical protein
MAELKERHIIQSNAQACVGDVRIGVGNLWERTYTDAEGHEQTGLTAMLWVSVVDRPEAFENIVAYPELRFRKEGIDFRVRDVGHDMVIIDSIRPA